MLRQAVYAFLQGGIIYALTMRFIGGPSYAEPGNGSFVIEGFGLLDKRGKTGGLLVDGFTMFTIIVIAMQVKVLQMTIVKTSVTWFMWVLSFVGYFSFLAVYCVAIAEPNAAAYNIRYDTHTHRHTHRHTLTCTHVHTCTYAL